MRGHKLRKASVVLAIGLTDYKFPLLSEQSKTSLFVIQCCVA